MKERLNAVGCVPMRAFLLVLLTFCVPRTDARAEIALRVTRPEEGEILTIAKGKTFVIGVVTPPTAALECNGARCDVSADGAFIGYAPFAAAPSPVRQGTNWCDVAFDFVLRANGEEIARRVWAISPNSPSAALVPEQAFDPPRTVRVLKEAWLGIRRGAIGRTLFAPKDALLSAVSAGTNGWRVRLEGREEAVVPLDLAEIVDEAPGRSRAWIIEDREGMQVTARRLGGDETEISSLSSCFWGMGFAVDGLRARILPRPMPKALARREAAEHPLRGMRIGLDPGHHPDRGAVGPRGLEERDANLRLAREVGRLLRAEGAEVVFTREEEALPLRERHARLRELDPEIVVSLHHNSVGDNADPRAKHGAQTFWYHPWSKDLAEKIHAAMLRALGSADLGCHRRDLYLPRYPGCPTVLLEPEYLILPEMEAAFLDAARRAKLAAAIVEGMRAFAATRRGMAESAF